MSKRWLAPWKDSAVKPVMYHCLSRVVDRRFVLGDAEREQFRKYMRMQEKFTGCRVLSYCVMSNHFHLLLEVPPMPEGGISDEELLKRLSAIQSEAFVAEVARGLAEARRQGQLEEVAAIHARHTYRMHDLSEFMKTLLQRFTRWFNRNHERRGTLWEERYKSVIVESGVAARTIAAYIDLNPVRAQMVTEPADYRWSSYGEAVGGGTKGNGKKAREGLVRACMSHHGVGFEAERWKEVSRIYRGMMGHALERKAGAASEWVEEKKRERHAAKVARKGTAGVMANEEEETVLAELGFGKMLRCKVRYFSEGAVIGGRGFVNEVFEAKREGLSGKRKDGARKLKGSGAPAAGVLWSLRDLRVGV